MALFHTTDDTGPNRFFEVRVAILVAGAIVGLIGIATERSWLVWVAIGIMAVGIVLRLISARAKRKTQD